MTNSPSHEHGPVCHVDSPTPQIPALTRPHTNHRDSRPLYLLKGQLEEKEALWGKLAPQRDKRKEGQEIN